MSSWIFLRHGESEANAGGWLAGHIDARLTPLGVEQALSAARGLSGVKLSRVISSDLSRAVETARPVLDGRGLELDITPDLRERSLGEWAYRRLGELRASGESLQLISWRGRPPAGESLRDVGERCLRHLASLEAIEGTTLVVAHGGVIRVLLGLIDGLPLEEIGKWKIANAVPHSRELEEGAFEGLLRRVLEEEGRE